MRARFKDAAGDHAVPGIRSVFVMAPAIVQGLAPESLRHMKVPVLSSSASQTPSHQQPRMRTSWLIQYRARRNSAFRRHPLRLPG
jgi:hypothetical protein